MAIYYPSICADNMFKLDIDTLVKQMKSWSSEIDLVRHHHILLTTTSSILSDSATKAASFLSNQLKLLRILQDDQWLNRLQVQIHPVNSVQDVIDTLASLVASFSSPISQLADQLVHSATFIKFQETKYSALQILSEGDLSLHNTYTLVDGLRSAEKICNASAQDLQVNGILSKDVASRLHSRVRGQTPASLSQR